MVVQKRFHAYAAKDDKHDRERDKVPLFPCIREVFDGKDGEQQQPEKDEDVFPFDLADGIERKRDEQYRGDDFKDKDEHSPPGYVLIPGK